MTEDYLRFGKSTNVTTRVKLEQDEIEKIEETDDGLEIELSDSSDSSSIMVNHHSGIQQRNRPSFSQRRRVVRELDKLESRIQNVNTDEEVEQMKDAIKQIHRDLQWKSQMYEVHSFEGP